MNDIALEVNNLSKKYGREKYAIQNLSFKVLRGQFHGFIGANGSGKTTSIKSIIGAYAKYQGNVKLFGKVNTSIEAKRHLGYIPEYAKFPEGMSTLKYLRYMAYLSGYDKKDAHKFAISKIKEFGLEKVAKKSPNQFSSGQKKKVLLAQALIGDPDLLIMDEPAANLDPMARVDFFSELKKLQKSGKAILISSHILAELDAFIDSVTIIDGGKLAFSGKISDIYKGTEKDYIFEFDELNSKQAFIKYLNDNKIAYRDNNQNIEININKDDELQKHIDFINANKLNFSRIQKLKMDLPSIYHKYVKLGSVATGTGRNEEVDNA